MKSERILPRVAALLLLLATASVAHAKAAFAGKTEMVRRSAAIAVVHITRVDPVQVKGQHWTYRQRATAKVETVLKANLRAGDPISLHGEEDFICAQCRFAPGRYLVFLNQDSGLWIGSNWHLSVRPITTAPTGEQSVEWYADEKLTLELKPQPLAEVLADVRKLLAD
jgi:hypothetical protein